MEVLKKKVLVVGLGRSGISAARWLSREGADVIIGDIKKKTDFSPDLLKVSQTLGVKLELDGHKIETFMDSDLIVVSPGVPLTIDPLIAAKEKGIPVIGEMELAARIMETPMIAITGTNGKTTSVSLLGSMIEKAGLEVFVGGNIGTPLMDYAASERKADCAVVEISSFQLDTMDELCPDVSLILNISPDHLDRYPDYEAYVRSKLRIYKDQSKDQFAIFNDDDERLARTKPKGPVMVLRYGWKQTAARHAYIMGDRLVAKVPGKEEYIFNTEKFKLPGKHNIENLMGVVLAGLALDLAPDAIQNTIDSFRGLHHRMEWVGNIKGVDFIDDSKATNVDAASRAVASIDRPLILIGGGRHKWGDYSSLVKVSEGRVKKVILLGEAKDIMAEAFRNVIPLSFAENMDNAVSQALSMSEAGDVVLLAPACSSFDMFSDYEHRGRVFQEAIERLNNG